MIDGSDDGGTSEDGGRTDCRLSVELFVDDVDASVAFYRDALRFSIERPDEGLVKSVRGSAVVAIGSVDALGDDHYFAPEAIAGRRGVGIILVLTVDDLGSERDRVRGSEYDVAEEIRERPWGQRDLRVVDLDGHYVLLTKAVEE